VTALVSSSDIGSGSGGSIWLTANSFSGNGIIQSNGGAGGLGGQNAGSGGGGRIALYANTNNATWQITARSGSTTGAAYVTGAAGVIYKEIAGASSVTIDNGNINPNDCYAYIEPGMTLDQLSIVNSGSLKMNVSGATVGTTYLQNQSRLLLESTGVLMSTVFNWDASTIIDRGGILPQITGGGSLVIPEGAYLFGDTARNYQDITVNGTLTHSSNAAVETYKLNYSLSGNLTVSGTGAIDVSEKGFASSEGTGQGVDSTSGGGGGGYGGVGGNGNVGAGGSAYGSEIAPNLLGSGGGADGVGNGGKGGGAAIFSVVGTTTINGDLLANGGNYVYIDSGGGSGGSIYIQTGDLIGTGTITANGGGGRLTTAGGGAGGRIAILYSSWNWTGSTLTNTAATAGGTGKNAGAIGTVYLESANEVPTALSVLLESGDTAANLTAGVTTPLVCTATINDPDGYLDISNVEATFYRTSLGYMAANNDNNHYSTSCVGGSGSGTNRPYSCTFNVQYHADATDVGSPNASDDWSCRITPFDSDGEGVSDVDYIEINSLTAIEVPNQLVLTSAIEPGEQTGNQNAILGITNVGNTALNVQFSGTDLCTAYPSCASGGVIGVNNIQFKEVGFTYGGGITLTSGIQLGVFTITKATTSPSNQSQNTYWGVAIPTSSIGGLYTGAVLLTGIMAE
jgi:hypothetical protein